MNAHQPDRNLQGAYQHLAAQTRADDNGKVYVFSSPQAGAGTSYVARNMALIAAAEATDGKQVLLLDMDLQNNAQSTYFGAPDAQAQYGPYAGPYDATFGTIPFWRVTPASVNEHGQSLSDSQFMSLQILGSLPLSYSHFHWENFREGQSVHIQNARPYWHALREHFSAIFVDTPALDRADILSTIAAEADTSILVSDSAHANDTSLSAAMKKITILGGQCAGVILNDGPHPHIGQGETYE